MDLKRFENIISRNESSILDFKSKQYKFAKEIDEDKTAEFIKDIISFTNTIRRESAFIIIGIEELKNGEKIYLGLDENIDDAILQQKIKDKVNPKPIFSYSIYIYKGVKYGIIEIPINFYQEPISPIKNLKGLEAGKVYFRRGSSNSEATINEIISINDWFRTLIPVTSKNKEIDQLAELLTRLNDSTCQLATIAAELLGISKKLNNEFLCQFFSSEIKGWTPDIVQGFPANYLDFRKIKVIYSQKVINHIRSYDQSYSGDNVYKDLLQRKDFYEGDLFESQPINFIENELHNIQQNGINLLYSSKHNLKQMLPDLDVSGEIMVYYVYETYYSLTQSIRHKYLCELMKLMK